MTGERRHFSFCAMLAMAIVLFGGGPQHEQPSPEELVRLWKVRLREFPPWKTSNELEFRNSFPAEKLSEKGVFLWAPHNLACDAEGNTYVTDQKQKCLFKFDPQGGFLLKKGREGQGPGDFLNPFCLCVSGRTVVVSDTGKRDIQIFDLELNLIKSFKALRAYYNLAVGRQGFIFATPLRMSPDMPLVDVLDGNGILQYSFGKPMMGNSRDWQLSNFVLIDLDGDGDLLLAYQHMATVCRYSPAGEMKAVYKIGHKGMAEAEKFNNDKFNEPGNNRAKSAILAIRAKKSGFYILHNYPIAEVLEFDGNGRPVNDHWVARSHDYHVSDFVVRESGDEGKIEVLLLQRSPDNRIEVFSPKRQSH